MKWLDLIIALLTILCIICCLLFIMFHGKWDQVPEFIPDTFVGFCGLPNVLLLFANGLLISKFHKKNKMKFLGYFFMLLSPCWLFYVLSVIPEKNY